MSATFKYDAAAKKLIKLANVEVEWRTLKPEEGFIPGDDFVSELEETNAKLLILNSPGNPTGAVIPERTIKKIMDVTSAVTLLLHIFRTIRCVSSILGRSETRC